MASRTKRYPTSFPVFLSRRAPVYQIWLVAGDGGGRLVVNDADDAGNTGRIVREMLPKAHFAIVYAKLTGRPVVDTFITEVRQYTWILPP